MTNVDDGDPLRDSAGFNQRANSLEANANKWKQMLANLLSFATAYFRESGLFKGLQAKEIRKSLRRSGSPGGLWSQRFKQPRPLSGPAGAERERNSAQQNTVTRISVFVKAIRYRQTMLSTEKIGWPPTTLHGIVGRPWFPRGSKARGTSWFEPNPSMSRLCADPQYLFR
jgi:hypothetical protein